ncbi:hypothetical protein CCACVL1_18973 [Corchorus capsularis]|uniref:Uncharacterized protein n=1 Tax=Corchorus capsularis TaxID=210143 RepID=A0A1R3HJ05_COCAP|nr:hypothetical protein CCACVL1_18973 [Corchorus capsularis]
MERIAIFMLPCSHARFDSFQLAAFLSNRVEP